MTVIIFIIVLAVLILVHELGHFLVAKKSGIRVDEFGLGFPPRLVSKKIGETTYSLNAIPFGGFVKIFGENPDQQSISGPDQNRSFAKKNRGIQSAVLVAGITFNIIFAWILISIGFMSGLPSSVTTSNINDVKDTTLVVLNVMADSPAKLKGLMAGDSILFIGDETASVDNNEMTVEGFQNFVGSRAGNQLSLVYKRGDENPVTIYITPSETIIEDRGAIGVNIDMVGTLKLPIHKALYEGGKLTIDLVKAVSIGIASFIFDAFSGQADFSEVSGPIGIAGLVGAASELGFIYLLSFTAFISINLAILNLLPFPALDGGRLLIVGIEAIRRKAISPKIVNGLNATGFVLLIILMVVVTYKDIVKLF